MVYTSPLGRPVYSKVISLLCEVFNHVAITARILFVHISTTVCNARYSSIQLSELWQYGVKKIAKALKRQQEDSRLRVLESEPTNTVHSFIE